MSDTAPVPYKITDVWDEVTLPAAIRGDHSTKAGTWGLLKVLEGSVWLVFHDPANRVHVVPGQPAPIAPQALHHVEIAGPMRMQVQFYREPPLPPRQAGPAGQDCYWKFADGEFRSGSSPRPRPATQGNVFYGWPGGGAGWCRTIRNAVSDHNQKPRQVAYPFRERP